MKKEISKELSLELLQSRIYFIRGMKVMFDRDLAELYGVKVKRLNEAVKRNLSRFPPDFMFQLSAEEGRIFLRSQFATLKMKQGKHLKYLPYVFTEQGVAMLSSVLNSERAIQVNIQIMRMFTRLRQIILTTEHLKNRIEELEKDHNEKFKKIFTVLELLVREEEKPKRKLGFMT